MPGRKTPLVTGQIYHILNRGISLQPTFPTKWDCHRAVELAKYYQSKRPPLRYSQFTTLSNKRRKKILQDLAKKKQFLVEIIAFCLMPNHFHFLLKQVDENGISKFMSNFTNSYTRYFNVKNKRNGPLFQGKFKEVRVESDEQLLHLARYIHLNPYSSFIVKILERLEDYSFSSLPEYLGKSETNFCNKETLQKWFKTPKTHRKFIFDQADYQRKLQEIKHLTLENL